LSNPPRPSQFAREIPKNAPDAHVTWRGSVQPLALGVPSGEIAAAGEPEVAPWVETLPVHVW